MKPLLTLLPMRAKITTHKQVNVRLEQVGIRLAPETIAELERIAEIERRKLAQVCRIAIEEFVERRKVAA